MADTVIEIPDRDLFKASEVCELAGVQPYVLRSWELEFSSLGYARTAGAPRVYRRADVERVLRIRQLVFVEGLTLAGARRRIDEDEAPELERTAAATSRAGADSDTRSKLDGIKRELRALLDLLGGTPTRADVVSWPPRAQPTLLEFDAGGAASGRGSDAGPKSGGKKRTPRAK
ncbi:MAG: MerR family transcriptional regulator [Acidobacteria bacterium]|nr:MerR family transcriptional regulator [Acidobacteriota bacterium]